MSWRSGAITICKFEISMESRCLYKSGIAAEKVEIARAARFDEVRT